MDAVLIERRDVLVPEARDRHVKDLLRENVKRVGCRSSGRLCVFHLPPRESHGIDPTENEVPPRVVRNFFRPVIAARAESGLPAPNPPSPRSDGQSSSAGRRSRHHEYVSQPAADSMLLRWRMPWQSVRAERTHESSLRHRREGICSRRTGPADARWPNAEQQYRGVSRSHFPPAAIARSGSRTTFEGGLSHLRRFSTRHPPDARGVSRAQGPPRSPTRRSFAPLVRSRCRIPRGPAREEPRRIPPGIEGDVGSSRYEPLGYTGAQVNTMFAANS